MCQHRIVGLSVVAHDAKHLELNGKLRISFVTEAEIASLTRAWSIADVGLERREPLSDLSHYEFNRLLLGEWAYSRLIGTT
jgi:hypothetical protein